MSNKYTEWKGVTARGGKTRGLQHCKNCVTPNPIRKEVQMKHVAYQNKKKAVLNLILAVLGLILLATPGQQAHAQATERVDFTVRTTTPNGNYSPRNIGAIWVEDSNGDFVKTLTVWADRRRQYLYTWDAASNRNTVDAVTSATSRNHATHDATWDCTDVNGNRVPDGTYTLRVEMTEEHAQGPLASFDFPVGQPSDTMSLSDETYFHDMELSWLSTLTAINDDGVIKPSDFNLEQNFPNPFNPSTTIRFSLERAGLVSLKIYNLLGEEVDMLVEKEMQQGQYTFQWNAMNMPSGVYFFRMETGGYSQTRKMLLTR